MQRIELGLLVNEVVATTLITLGGVDYTVRKRLPDDGVIWRVQVDS
ncbi:hypothetical protein ACJJIP_07590 [Microbulbifer sp. VTAC004]|nr:hypothetical protein [Microbulbifer variabilis]